MSDNRKRVGPDVGAAASESRIHLDSDYDRGEFGSPAGYDAVAPDPDGVDPFYILRLLHRWRWAAITVFLLVVIGTAVYTFTVVPIYEAHTRVLVEPERFNIVKIEDVVEQDRSIETQIAVLQSRWLAKETMADLNLLNTPAVIAPPQPHEPPTGPAALWSRTVAYLRALKSRGAPPRVPAFPGEIHGESAQIGAFLGGLTVTSTTKGVLDIRYRSTDPVLAARIANGLARQYMQQNLEIRFAAIKEVNEWLAARLREQRQKVDASEGALRRFREDNEIVAADGADNLALAKLNELIGESTRAKTARLEKESLLDKMEGLGGNQAALQRLPRIAADPIVQQLRLELQRLQSDRIQMAEKLQDRHPEMVKMRAAIQATQAKFQDEMDRIVEGVREEVAAARTTERNLTVALERQKQEALAQNRNGVELGVLEREAQSSRQIYDMLMQRARETNIAKEIRPSEIQVLDAAEVPSGPVSPRTRQDMMLAVFGGLVLAVACALGLDQLDNRLKLPDEIKTRLGLPLLGFIPEVRGVRTMKEAPIMTNGVPPVFVEAMRSVRTNVLYSFAEESLKSVVITSANISEGKTVVASNLAIAIAQAGQRVLLIDADMRRPTLHNVFGVEREPGLSNLLVGNIEASEAVQRSKVPNLWVLPSGHRPPNPPELLASKRFTNMLAAFGDHFDWVIFDAPPVMPVTDVCVLAQKTTGVLFVVGAELVSRHVARRALDQLGGVDARVVGGILTRVDLDRNAYYYAHYYHRRYSDYAAPAPIDV